MNGIADFIHLGRHTHAVSAHQSSRQAAVDPTVVSRVMTGIITVSDFFLKLADFRLQLLACHVDFHVLGYKCFVLLIQLLQCPAVCFLSELPLFVDTVSVLREFVYIVL